MRRLNSALFVDFDNIFLSIRDRDEAASQAFGTQPQMWTDWLEDTVETPGHPENELKERAFLVRRCYSSPRAIQYFRAFFGRNAFSVIECPPMTRGGKNSADIYMVMDILDTLTLYPHIEEFVIFSADADFMPVVTRLRAHGKRTVIYANEVTAAAYKSACDDMVAEGDFVQMLRAHVGAIPAPPPHVPGGRPVAPRPPRPAPPQRVVPSNAPQPAGFVPGPQPVAGDETLTAELVGAIREAVVGQDGPVPLRDLVDRLMQRFQERIDRSNWAGTGTVTQFLKRNPVEGVRVQLRAPAFLYDPARYGAALEAQVAQATQPPAGVSGELGDFIRRVNSITNVPDLAPETYAALFTTLEEDLREKPYALWNTANGVRSRLEARGVDVPQRMVFFILKGLELSRHRFSETDTAESLARQFRTQVTFLARNAQLPIGDGETAFLEQWITHDPSAAPRPASPPTEPPVEAPAEAAAETIEDVLPDRAAEGEAAPVA